MIQIELSPLGHREKGDPDTIWHDVKHSDAMPAWRLAHNLANLWCARRPAGADGPATSIRFVQSH